MGHGPLVILSEVVVTSVVSLAFVARTGADAVVVVVWRTISVLDIETEVLVAVLVITINTVVDSGGVTIVVDS